MQTITTNINVNNNSIGILRVGDVDYISLTDLAKYSNPDYPSHVIVQWLSNKTTFNYLGLWERINNTGFNFTEFSKIKKDEVGLYAFTMSPKRWITSTNAKGIFLKAEGIVLARSLIQTLLLSSLHGLAQNLSYT